MHSKYQDYCAVFTWKQWDWKHYKALEIISITVYHYHVCPWAREDSAIGSTTNWKSDN